MVNIAGIGLGGLGQRELDIYAEMDDVTIVAGADPADGPREAFEETHDVPTYDDYEALLEAHDNELDAVSIVTPHTLHYDQARDALNRDLDVFVEKPMVTAVADAVSLVELVEERDRTLQVGYQRHFHPAYRQVKELVDSGAIGDIHMVNCFLGQHWIDLFQDSWRAAPELSGGGQLYDSGSHLLDTLLWTTGTTPQSVASAIDRRDHDADVNSALAATLDRDGSTVTASIGVTADGTSTSGTEEGLFIWGTDGRIAFENGRLTTYGKGEGEEDTSTRISLDAEPDFRTLATSKLRNFVDAVAGEATPAVPAEFGLQVTAFTEAAYRAYERGERVSIPDLIEEHRPVKSEQGV